MDILLLLKAALLGVVEGLTEFLPVSSTGHLIVAGSLLGFSGEFAKAFEIVIQGAAILAVIWEYRSRIATTLSGLGSGQSKQTRFAFNLLLAFLPLAICGLLFKKRLDDIFFNPISVAAAFIIGGLVIIWAEKRQHQVRYMAAEDLRLREGIKLGLAQMLALIPGTSRSGATIIGGLFFGLSRVAATEFSFFLAIPTLLAATFYEGFKYRELLFHSGNWQVLLVGSITSFVSAFFAIRIFLRYISTHNFISFAWYRIGFGFFILLSHWLGWIVWAD